jgi:nicotinamide riboside kinase
MSSVLRIAIVGPESCGKTTLAVALAARLGSAGIGAAVVEEYAREYYAQRAYHPTPADVLAIAHGQLAAERRAAQAGCRVLLCDSTVLTCLVWSEVAFGVVAPELAGLCRPRNYGLTLLPRPDIPWAPDPLREHPQARDMLLQRYRCALTAAGVQAVEIYGNGDAREEMAWNALARTLAELPKI